MRLSADGKTWTTTTGLQLPHPPQPKTEPVFDKSASCRKCGARMANGHEHRINGCTP